MMCTGQRTTGQRAQHSPAAGHLLTCARVCTCHRLTRQGVQRQAQELQQRLQESEQSMVSLQEELLECCPHGSCKPHPPNRPPMITDNFPHDVAQLRSFLDKHSLWQAGTQGELWLAHTLCPLTKHRLWQAARQGKLWQAQTLYEVV